MSAAELVLHQLRRASDRTLVLDPYALERLTSSLDALGAGPPEERWAALEELLRLATALEQLGSPRATAQIRRLVGESPWALPLLLAHSTAERQRRDAQSLARFSGALAACAPRIDEAPPRGSLVLRTMLSRLGRSTR